VVLFTVGGVPSVYAGDEWGYLGVKEERFGGDDAVRPEFGSPPSEPVDGTDVLRLHQHLIGLRRRHPWLTAARTTKLSLGNAQYVYRTSAGSDALLVALNLDDARLQVSLAELGVGGGRVVAGSGAPAERDVDRIDVDPHGWLIVSIE
jgi:glycosidase